MDERRGARRRARLGRCRSSRSTSGCGRSRRWADGAPPSSRPAPSESTTSTRTSCTARRNLARRNDLRDDLARVDADVYLVEIKAAAIDVVAEAALERGVEVVFAENEVVADGLDEHIETLAGRMLERVA